MSEEPETAELASEVRPRRDSINVWSLIKGSIALVIAAGLIVIIAGNEIEKSQLKLELAKVQTQREDALEHLQSLSQKESELQALDKQTNGFRRQLRAIYADWRDVDDFAENPSQLAGVHVASTGGMNDTIRLTIPEGKHKFWAQVTRTNRETKEKIDDQTIQWDLVGGAGYVIYLDHSLPEGGKYKDPRRLHLKATSTSPEFAPRSESLFEPFPTPSSSSSSGSINQGTFFFPNQYDRYNKGEGVLLNRMRWSITRDQETPFDVAFEFRLISDGPVVTDAPNALMFRYRKDIKTSYLGDGKFEVIKVQE